MGTLSVLVIGAEPLLQVHRFNEPHELNGGGSWLFCTSTIDRWPLEPGADGRILQGGRDPWETYHEVFTRYPADNSGGERYRAQPAVRAMREAGLSTERSCADWYALPRHEYVDWARASALVDDYFQIVHDGEPLIGNSEDAWMREMYEAPQPVTEYLARRHAFFARLQAILDAAPGHTLLTSVLVKV